MQLANYRVTDEGLPDHDLMREHLMMYDAMHLAQRKEKTSVN